MCHNFNGSNVTGPNLDPLPITQIFFNVKFLYFIIYPNNLQYKK